MPDVILIALCPGCSEHGKAHERIVSRATRATRLLVPVVPDSIENLRRGPKQR